jgi:DNA-directed RNA polymerase subunit K
MVKEQQEFSKYERARILGARALQISMDAPLLMKVDDADLENLNFDPLKIAQKELDSGVLPITINRPMPEKRDEKLKEIKIEELEKEEEEKAKEAPKEEDKEESDETATVVTEEKATEVADMKSDEEVEEEVESEGAGEDLGGGDEGGSSEE